MLLRRCALRTAARRTTTTSTTAAPLSSTAAAVAAIPGADHKYVIKSPAPPLELPPSGQLPNFTDFMTKGFAANGDKAAVVVENPDGSVDVRTYADLLADVESVAHELRTQMNFQAGDTALLVSPNHADYFAAVHSVLKLNGVLSPANPLYSSHEIGNQLKDCGKVVMSHPFCLEKVLEAVAASGRAEEVRVVVVGADAPAGSGATPFAALKGTGASVGSLGPVSDEQLAVLPYSSGTTGLPKGTMLTHRNLVANVLQFEYVDGRFWEKGNETLMSPLPFFHIYGFTASLNITLFYNSTLVTMPAFDLEKFLGVVQDRKCTKAHLVPPIILGLAKHPLVDKYDLSSMQCIVSGAAPLGSEVAQACAARLGCIVKQAWGMSELAPIGSVNPDDDNREGSSGCTVASMLYKIVDTETGALLPPGEEGEVVCTGPNVMTGYLNNPEANATAFDEDGWFKTGDIGFVDGDGWITFTDRLKAHQVQGLPGAPAELEALLLTHPQIDAAVILVLDDAAEVPRAFVTRAAAADEFDAEAIAAGCRAPPRNPRRRRADGRPDVIPSRPRGRSPRVLVQRNKDGEFDK